jgi:protein farnesyltransferase subunit beta
MLYWCLHGLDLLGERASKDLVKRSVSFLSLCQHENGGFGGGPGQLGHLAPTYAAVLSIAVLGCEEAYAVVDRAKMRGFLLSLWQDDGGCRMHDDGEVDLRASYCNVCVATLLGIDLPEDVRRRALAFVQRCQTQEGGFGAVPGNEAHGGYTFCAAAALALLGGEADTPALLRWLAGRQMEVEGGFQGRTHKLVDGCYSFWQGSTFALLPIFSGQVEHALAYDRVGLQRYVLLAGQNPGGGLRDKPSAGPDFYHTCYCLSGFSTSQHGTAHRAIDELFPEGQVSRLVVGDQDNLLEPVNAVFNVTLRAAKAIRAHFCSKT